MKIFLLFLMAISVSAIPVWSADNTTTTVTYVGSSFEIQTAVGVPLSKLPGPARQHGPWQFILTDTNSVKMQGMNDPVNERWCDMAGNFYSSTFINRFSYEKPSSNGPVVRVKINPEAATFSGRLEARGLKPNFAYQIKLRGLFSDRKSFDAIGLAGRWRLPGLRTNYTDDDYLMYPDKDKVESYLFFDYFVTDSIGNAVREFALDSSLHVLWSYTHQYVADVHEESMVYFIYAASPYFYTRPKTNATAERVWAEREMSRYTSADQVRFLMPGEYRAELVLTEESFHSWYRDGGYWATVYKTPVEFQITGEIDTKKEAKPAANAPAEAPNP